MRKEDMESVGKAISVIIDKCHSRVIIEPIKNKLESEHGECESCAFDLLPEYNYPCTECKNNYISHWRAKDD